MSFSSPEEPPQSLPRPVDPDEILVAAFVPALEKLEKERGREVRDPIQYPLIRQKLRTMTTIFLLRFSEGRELVTTPKFHEDFDKLADLYIQELVDENAELEERRQQCDRRLPFVPDPDPESDEDFATGIGKLVEEVECLRDSLPWARETWMRHRNGLGKITDDDL